MFLELVHTLTCRQNVTALISEHNSKDKFIDHVIFCVIIPTRNFTVSKHNVIPSILACWLVIPRVVFQGFSAPSMSWFAWQTSALILISLTY